MKAFLANVMDAFVYSGDQLLFTSKALTDSSISIGITAEEVRGGKGNKLIGRYFHDSSFGLTLQDALFELGYIAHNVGSQVVTGTSGSLTEEQVVASASGTLSVTGTTGVTLADGSAIVNGDTYCVKYMSEAACDEVVVSADFVPDEVTVVLKGDLYKASRGNDVSTSSIIGHIEVVVPRFQLEGSMEISLSSSGAAQIPFSGQALVTTDASAGCEGGGYYAVIRKFETSANWYDNLVAFALEGSDSVTVATNTTKKLNVYGIFSNGSAKLISSANLKFTTSGSIGTISDGVLTAASSAGSGTITVECSGTTNPKPSVQLVINVTVSD